ncbi:LPP20 family lipoprotein [Photobacterium rosenbergii]|uniref:LPP20 family lipoprotein n=1 Tax=Photobacterium rosenbergii TaxID=294936 RepID=A0ABU3ZM04_9GAMM|nr:LPP20 family lipoprotein [Photobacterium rosenbergii]MDV5171151.1 LPP20 family lipoprotein [Photobacterium rosenbergii]
MRYWCLFVLAFLVGCQPLVETRNTDIITAVGYASISEQPGKSIEEKRMRAMRASKLDAYRELTEQIYGIRITARAEMDDQQLNYETNDSSVDGSIRGAEVIRSYPIGDNYVTEMQLDLNRMERLKGSVEVYSVPQSQEVMF